MALNALLVECPHCGGVFSHREITLRETQILEAIAAGNTNLQIGRKLGISEQTVKNHVTSILVKLHADSRAHAIAKAIKQGIITV